MPLRVRSVLALLIWSAIAIVRPAVAQSTAAPEPQPTGTARISGRVLAKDNGAPVRRARVRIEGTPAETKSAGPKRAYVQREVETNENGAFEFAGLPGGTYHISVPDTNGFVTLARARKAIVGEGEALEVAIPLERTGAIVGRIADRNGEGVLGVEVLAVRRNEFRGRVTLMADYRSRGATNDLGQFRLFNLSPGEYFVVASPVVRTPVDSRLLGATRRSGFLTTYYPGTQQVGQARLVVVRSGKDVPNVSFSLASGPLATVAIDALDSRGQRLGREASANLNLIGDVNLSSSMRQAERTDDGQFLFSEIPLGDYDLIVRTSYRQEEATYVHVKVDADVTLKVQTNSGATVSGRVVVQGATPESESGRAISNVVISAMPPAGWTGPSYFKDALTHPQGTDTFELTGLRGPMVLHAQMGGALLASISRAGGEDLAGKPLDFTGTEIIDDVLVVFTHDQANLEVTLTGLREPDDPEKVLVVLFAEDSARWHAGSVQYTVIEASAEMPPQRATAAGAGRRGRMFTFPFGPVVPGRYLIAAVPSPGVMFPTAPAILDRLRPVAVPVTLVAGATAKVEVSVSRPQRGGKGK